MTHPNRTPEDELRAELWQLFESIPSLDKDRPTVGVAQRYIEVIAEWILAGRKAQATAMLEKGPKDNWEKYDGVNVGMWAQAENKNNAQWRSIIKEVGGLDE